MALDYGSARTGVAISDPSGTVVRPLDPVLRANSSDGLASLARMVVEHDVGRVVVGLPRSLSGEEGVQAARSRSFADRLRGQLDVPVELYDERFTTRLADQFAGDSTASRDSLAACHLLTSYLESRR